MNALLLDVGNTRIKWGVLDGGNIQRTGHISRAQLREQGLQILTTRVPRHVDKVFASNVAGTSFGTRLAGVIGMHCNCDIRFARASRRGWGVTNGYTQPRRMGVDRWVAMVAAWAEIGKACLVVDAGTAITLDALDDEGVHIGGQIIPGVGLMARSLASGTSDIAAIKPKAAGARPDSGMFGRNTTAAVREGVQNAAAGAVDRAFRTLQSSAYEPTIVLTGGDASRILNALCVAPVHRPHLVLHGLAHMLETAQ